MLEVLEKLNNFLGLNNSVYIDAELIIKSKEDNEILNKLYIQCFDAAPNEIIYLLDRDCGLIEAWDEVFSKAIDSDKEPIIIFSCFGELEYAMITEVLFTNLNFHYGKFKGYYLDFHDGQYDNSNHYIILKLDDFLNFVDQDGLKLILGE